jgi:hypothetical protein
VVLPVLRKAMASDWVTVVEASMQRL